VQRFIGPARFAAAGVMPLGENQLNVGSLSLRAGEGPWDLLGFCESYASIRVDFSDWEAGEETALCGFELWLH